MRYLATGSHSILVILAYNYHLMVIIYINFVEQIVGKDRNNNKEKGIINNSRSMSRDKEKDKEI